MSKSPHAADLRQFTVQLTQPAAQDSKERVLHPVHGGRSPIRPHIAEVGLKPMVHPAHWPTAQCKQSEKGTHALSARTAPRVLRGHTSSEAPARRPPMSPPSSGPSVPPEPTMATHTVSPPTRGARRQPVLTTAPPTSDVLPLKVSRPSLCSFRGPPCTGGGTIII